MRDIGSYHDWLASFTLTVLLHILVVLVAFLPLGNYFFPFIEEVQLRGLSQGDRGTGLSESKNIEREKGWGDRQGLSGEPGQETSASALQGQVPGVIPYQFARSLRQRAENVPNAIISEEWAVELGSDKNRKPRSLSRLAALPQLLPPSYSSLNIPVKPRKSMLEEIEENAEDYLLSSVLDEAVPATYTKNQILQAEQVFIDRVREDIKDGTLDMAFADFIIPAEFYLLGHTLIEQGLQPAFSLEEAFDLFHAKVNRVRAGLVEELNGFNLVMILQRYAENKFYPGNGSGMLLDGLFHNLNDCEGGTKEVIAYLDALYPELTFGTNRGMLQTTTGEVIGHMQVFLHPNQSTQRVLENREGLVIETTAISEASIQPYRFGDVFPLEDFVAQFYPEVVVGTPLEQLLSPYLATDSDGIARKNIVGTSNNPLKMSYGTGLKLLSKELYDLENIRTQQLANLFQQSPIVECNPNIEPLEVTSQNLFSNFVAIDAKLRRSLVKHYLADMKLWDNRIMPQWQEPDFLANYSDLETTLMAFSGETEGGDNGYIQIDSDTTLARESLQSHARFLHLQKQKNGARKSPYTNTGEQVCSKRALIDDPLLAYLFRVPLGPGIFFLPEPGERFPWDDFSRDVVKDCLAVPLSEADRKLFIQLDFELSEHHGSFRKELYSRAQNRGVLASSGGSNSEEAKSDLLAGVQSILKMLFLGSSDELQASGDIIRTLENKPSQSSTKEEPSVKETIAELGRTGINSGLLWDTLDFMGPETLRQRFTDYAKRKDLNLTTTRANVLVQNVVSLLSNRGVGESEIESLLIGLWRPEIIEPLRLASAVSLWHLQGKDPKSLSIWIRSYLEGRTSYSAELVTELLQFGLYPEDARLLIIKRITEISDLLPKTWSTESKEVSSEYVFHELIELVRSARSFQDKDAHSLIFRTISSSLVEDMEKSEMHGAGEKKQPDFGVLVTKIYLLALLQQGVRTDWQDYARAEERRALFGSFLKFASQQPLGKLTASLVLQAYSLEERIEYLRFYTAKQFQSLDSLIELAARSMDNSEPTGTQTGEQKILQSVADLIGQGNIFYRMLDELPDEVTGKMYDLSAGTASGGTYGEENQGTGPEREYLSRLLKGVAPLVSRYLSDSVDFKEVGEPKVVQATIPVDLYNDPGVREFMALLGYGREASTGNIKEQRVKFRKSKDLRKIKDLSKIKVIKGSRKITRQDMSLLTLALNTNNKPEILAEFWKRSLVVIDKHIGLEYSDVNIQEFLFAPHYPYLTRNHRGFFYPPETVKDLHNASEWGGKNDILLSSYLHFKNLPEQLPEWLVATAMGRSEFERRIIKKFEQQTFLPMILECSSDKDEYPDGLFEAKWSIRKPFGEDIFPGTLLLLRMGYMEITEGGEIVLTEKGIKAGGRV